MGYSQDMFYGIKEFKDITEWVRKLKLIDYSQFIKEKKETFKSWNDKDIKCEDFFAEIDMEKINEEEFCEFLFGEGYFEDEMKDLLKKFFEENKMSTPFMDYDSTEFSIGLVVYDYDTFKEKEIVDKFCEKYDIGKATYFIGYDLSWC